MRNDVFISIVYTSVYANSAVAPNNLFILPSPSAFRCRFRSARLGDLRRGVWPVCPELRERKEAEVPLPFLPVPPAAAGRVFRFVRALKRPFHSDSRQVKIGIVHCASLRYHDSV